MADAGEPLSGSLLVPLPPPGAIVKITAGSLEIALAHRDDGCVFALEDRCPHSGGPLSEGALEPDGTWRCPWHDYRFDPATGACVNHNIRNANTFPARRVAGEVRVELVHK